MLVLVVCGVRCLCYCRGWGVGAGVCAVGACRVCIEADSTVGACLLQADGTGDGWMDGLRTAARNEIVITSLPKS